MTHSKIPLEPLYFHIETLTSYRECPPSPEVTELICQVPSPTFFHRFGILYLSTGVGFYTLA